MGRGMLAWEATLVGLQAVAGASVLLEWLPQRWVGLAVVVVGAAQLATAFYKRGLVTPAPDAALPAQADGVARYVAPQVNRD